MSACMSIVNPIGGDLGHKRVPPPHPPWSVEGSGCDEIGMHAACFVDGELVASWKLDGIRWSFIVSGTHDTHRVIDRTTCLKCGRAACAE